MRRSSRPADACKWMLIAIAALAANNAGADEAIVTNEREFAIPVQIAGGDVAEVRLYCSTDAGKTWQLRGQSKPPLESFDFAANDDREYWFLVRTVDPSGREISDAKDPELKVIVDTTPPRIDLRAEPLPTGEFVVHWKIEDLRADADSLKLKYRTSENAPWAEVIATRTKRQGDVSGAAGTLHWLPPSNLADVLLRAETADTAGNVAAKELRLGQAAADDKSVAAAKEPQSIAAADPNALSMPAGPRNPAQPLFVNSLSFELDYDVDRVPAASIEKVELWGTRDDGVTWVRLGVDADRRSPCTVNVEREGRYGFIIVAAAAGGVAGRTPREGESPEIRVIVDLSAPKVRLTTAEPDPAGEPGSLKINWQATDQYLGPKAVSLAYSSSAHGPWLPLAIGVSNDGGRVCHFDLQSPDNVFLRIEVRDEAGNLGAFSTTASIPIEKRQVNARVAGGEKGPRTGVVPKWFHVLR